MFILSPLDVSMCMCRQVKEAYYTLAKKLHPDAQPNANKDTLERSQAQFAKLTDSFKFCFELAKDSGPNWVKPVRQKKTTHSTAGVTDEQDDDEDMDRIVDEVHNFFEMEWEGLTEQITPFLFTHFFSVLYIYIPPPLRTCTHIYIHYSILEVSCRSRFRCCVVELIYRQTNKFRWS